jgi:AcrR family transcriptional regulator
VKPTEQRILEAAGKLFSQQGFHATGMRAIARAAKVSLGTIYHHFKSKEEMLLALLRDEYEKRRKAIEELKEEGLPVSVMIQRIAELHFRLLLEEGPSLRPLAQSLRGLSPMAKRRALAMRQAFVNYLASLIAEGIERGQIRRCDPTIAAYAFLGMVESVSARALEGDEVAERIQRMGPRELAEIAWRALAPKPS